MSKFVDLICKDCGDVYRSDEGQQYHVVVGSAPGESRTYCDPPYNWHPANGYCLACWICPGWHENRRPEHSVHRN